MQDSSAKLLLNKIAKYSNLYKISTMQLQTKKFEEILSKSAKLSFPEAQLRQKLQEQKLTNEKILESLNKIQEDYPQYVNLISPLIELIQ